MAALESAEEVAFLAPHKVFWEIFSGCAVLTDKFKGIAPSIELIKKCKNEFNLLDTNVINSIPEE